MTIEDLHIGQSAAVKAVGGKGTLRNHFLDMGIIPGAEVKLVKAAPMGDPLEILVQGFSLTLRKTEAAQIEVSLVDKVEDEQVTLEDSGYNSSLHEHNSHPGYGEDGKYHSKSEEKALPKDIAMTFALVGQQNCGKTTLFNQLTGSNQHVGNFPGVTVDRKDGQIRNVENATVTDLPGIYSLSTYTEEELVARRYILDEKPKAIINIVDAGNIERHLYLTMQLMELEVPVVLALNMMDEVRANGGTIRVNEMEKILGMPVVPISASKGEGINELVEHAMHIARYQEPPMRQDFCSKDDCNGAVHRCMHSIMDAIEDHAQAAGLPLRFAAGRIVVGDDEVMERLKLDENEKELIEHIISQMEQERGLDRYAAMSDMRYSFINRLSKQTVVKPKQSKERLRSDRLDKILTGKWTAIPVFLAIIAGIFWLTFDVIGFWLQSLLAGAFDSLGILVSETFTRWNISPAITSLVVDAIIGGVGSVLSFVPFIIVLFFFLSMLEDSGYMARIAFVSDKLLRKIGLSGRSIVPMLIGFGCTVPGVMAARTLPSAHDRRVTIMLTPFISCSAKTAIYGFLAAAFFPGHAGLVMILIYLLGIVVGIIVSLVYKYARRKYEPAPFVMELPVYRLPNASNVGHLLWDKVKDFVQKAFTVIFIATIVIWFLQTFDYKLNMVEDGRDSMLAWIAGLIAPAFEPIGLGDWRIVTSLISGFLAKESVVATLEVLGVMAAITATTAVPLLIFCMLYTPCIAAIASVRRELGLGWAIFMLVFQCVLAWLCAWVGYLIVV